MPQMTHALTYLYLAAFLQYVTSAQVLRFVRTDPTANPTIITATKLFGLDVMLDSIASVTAVSFELRYSGAHTVRLAAWKPRALSRHSVYVIDLSDTATGNGSIHIGVLSGQASTEQGVDSPTVLHLDFVVLPQATHGAFVQFEARNAEAVVGGATPTIVPLRSVPLVLRVHSFITVYPGDANNDGRVNQRDFSTVALYLGQGTANGAFRGYRRQPASTLWEPQSVLAWDVEQATYADCDGSGDITLGDALVVKMNYDSSHSQTSPTSGSEVFMPQPLPETISERTFVIPHQGILSLAFELVIPGLLETPNVAVSGWTIDFIHYDPTTGRTLCIVSSNQPRDVPTIALRVCSSSGVELSPTITNAYALLEDRKTIVPLTMHLSSIEETSPQRCLRIYPQPVSDDEIAIECSQTTIASIRTSDGRTVAQLQLLPGTVRYSIAELPNGVYQLHTATCSTPFIIVR
jgi:hypothetical protein